MAQSVLEGTATLRVAGNVHTYTARYNVTTDSNTDYSLAALEAGQQTSNTNPVPQKWAYYSVSGETDTSALAQDFNIQRRGYPKVKDRWTIDVTWRPSNNTDQSNSNPTAREAVLSIDWVEDEEIVTQAYNETELTAGTTRTVGTLGIIENAARQEFDEPLTRRKRTPVLVVRKNYATLAEILNIHRTYENTLNSGTFYGYPAKQVKFLSIEVEEARTEFNNNVTYVYFPTRLRFALSDSTWTVPIVNRGFKVWNSSEGKAVPAFIDGAVPSEPVLLKADGTLLNDGTLGNTIDYRIETTADYSALGLPGS